MTARPSPSTIETSDAFRAQSAQASSATAPVPCTIRSSSSVARSPPERVAWTSPGARSSVTLAEHAVGRSSKRRSPPSIRRSRRCASVRPAAATEASAVRNAIRRPPGAGIVGCGCVTDSYDGIRSAHPSRRATKLPMNPVYWASVRADRLFPPTMRRNSRIRDGSSGPIAFWKGDPRIRRPRSRGRGKPREPHACPNAGGFSPFWGLVVLTRGGRTMARSDDSFRHRHAHH